MIYDAIVVGGSVSGLSAAMALGRSMMRVLCVDAGEPCNRYAHESHNFIGRDGFKPLDIISTARSQIAQYKTVEFVNDYVSDIKRVNDTFDVSLRLGNALIAKKLILATGMDDQIQTTGIKNVEKFWGNSIIHCPFCHGYEYANKKTVLYYESPQLLQRQLPMLYNWSKDITVITSAKSVEVLSEDFHSKLEKLNITLHKGAVQAVEGDDLLKKVILDSGKEIDAEAMYLFPPSKVQNYDLYERLGIEFNPETKLINATPFQKTNIPGIFAAGDCCQMMRQIATAASQGGIAGAICVHELTAESWGSL